PGGSSLLFLLVPHPQRTPQVASLLFLLVPHHCFYCPYSPLIPALTCGLPIGAPAPLPLCYRQR
ncbi:MAG: hypothetical protein ACOYL5_13455, partial [Phototrophicaceae bacterium]